MAKLHLFRMYVYRASELGNSHPPGSNLPISIVVLAVRNCIESIPQDLLLSSTLQLLEGRI